MENERRILLVEDTLTQAMLYQHMLEKKGFEVKVARSGRQALEQIAKDKPRAILSDINMPEMSGYELCQKLKNDDTTSDIIVILLTTTFSEESIFECITCGADEITLKGLKEDAFVDVIERSLKRKIEFSGHAWIDAVVERSDGTQQRLGCNEAQVLRLLFSVYDLLTKVQQNN